MADDLRTAGQRPRLGRLVRPLHMASCPRDPIPKGTRVRWLPGPPGPPSDVPSGRWVIDEFPIGLFPPNSIIRHDAIYRGITVSPVHVQPDPINEDAPAGPPPLDTFRDSWQRDLIEYTIREVLDRLANGEPKPVDRESFFTHSRRYTYLRPKFRPEAFVEDLTNVIEHHLRKWGLEHCRVLHVRDRGWSPESAVHEGARIETDADVQEFERDYPAQRKED